MNEVLLKTEKPGQFFLEGMLTFQSVPKVAKQANALFEETSCVSVDLKGISFSDSSGLALLSEWVRHANRLKKSIIYKNVPSQMLAIAELSGLTNILPLENCLHDE